MDQITVPQFLDTEDRIIGEITVRQFLEMLVGGGIIFILYKTCDFSLFLLSGIVVFLLTVLFAFVKIQGQLFHVFLLNVIITLKNPKLKVWKKEKIFKIKEVKIVPIIQLKKQRTMVTSSKLSELSLIVDTGGFYRGEEDLLKDLNLN